MDGVLVLNTITETVYRSVFRWNAWSIFWFAVVIALCVIALLGVIDAIADVFCWDGETDFFCIFGGALIALLFLLFMSIAGDTKVIDHEEVAYEVLLEDNVSMNEFTSRYNILEIRDKIYVVQEKETE